MWSTSRNELITAFTRTKRVVGISSGNVTRRKKYQRPAPAKLAVDQQRHRERQRDRRRDRAEREEQVVLQRLPEDRIGRHRLVVIEADPHGRAPGLRRREERVIQRAEGGVVRERDEQQGGGQQEQPAGEVAVHQRRYGLRIRSASACASFIACAGDLAPVSAACSPSLSALVTRWFSCVESSATAYCSWSRATAAAGKSATYFFIAAVCQASSRTAT